MEILGQEVLTEAGKRNKPLRAWLNDWEETVRQNQWTNLAEVRAFYPATDGVALKSQVVITIFNVNGNEYRMLTSIDYDDAFVQVLAVMTHAEYDKNLWKARY